jgi:AAA+ ATPase superfamily predicted ATPase
MQPPFLGRDRELVVLQQLHDTGKPELYVLYGRRRVGKTELLQQFCQGRRAVYFLAAQVREKDNLRAFRDALRDALGDELVGSVDFRDWGAALGYASERAAGQRLVIVLDEFPYLCEANKGLPSQLQQFWDTRGKRSNLLLVLCGSQVSFMEEEVLAERSPLFGRRTAQRRLEPLRPHDALRFFPKWKSEDRLFAWSILGGMPAYLRRFDERVSVEQNLLREVLSPEGYLFDEPQFLLRAEFASPTTYNSCLAAVAQGAQRVGDIALSVGVDATTANKYLHTLRELRIVARDIPLTDPDPLRSRRGTYRIEDRYLAFHFRHVQPHVSLIEAGRGSRVLETSVLPDRPRLLEDARVDFVLDHLRHEAGTLLGDEIVESGRHGGARVRAVGRTAQGVLVAAALAPSGSKAGIDAELATELHELERATRATVRALVYRVTGDLETPVHAALVDR